MAGESALECIVRPIRWSQIQHRFNMATQPVPFPTIADLSALRCHLHD